MCTKQSLSIAGILVVLAAIAGALSFIAKPHLEQQTARTSPVLHGTATSTGDFEYTETAPGYTVDIVYPQATGLDAAADVKARTTMEQGLLDELNVFKTDAAGMLTADEIARLNESGRSYAFGMTYTGYRGAGTVSYAFRIYEDTGGAHPNGFYKTFVFNSQGQALTLNDLFVATSTNPHADWLNQISGAASVQVRDELTRRLGQDPGQSFFDEGTAPKEENFKNFVIDGDELVLLFPPYQVAAYAAGSFEVRIPFESLKDILQPQFVQ